jgi:hypothetical protein
MKRVLSFDPGHTTGIACYGEEGELEFATTVESEPMAARYFLSSLVRMAQPDIVLVEEIPLQRRDAITTANYYYLTHWFSVAGYDVETILPGQWKGMTKRVEIPGQHARDAATMAKWWIEKEEN